MKRIGLALGLCILIGVTLYSGLADYVSLATIKQQSDHFAYLVKHYYVWSSAVYIAVYMGGVFCGLPIVMPMTMLGGYLFGLLKGALYALTGATLGSVAYFLFIRYVLFKKATTKYSDRLARFKNLMLTYGPSYLLFLHFITIIPYVVINTLAGLAQIELPTFIWTTMVGAIPSIFLYSFAGRQLGTIESIRDIMKPHLLLLFLALAIIALIPIIINKWRKPKTID